MAAYQLPIAQTIPCTIETEDILEDEMFYLPNITLLSKYTVECYAQVMPQSFVLQPGT